MDFEAFHDTLAKAGPHPGLSEWHKKTILLYRCRDISADEFRRRIVVLSQKFEKLLEQALPENLEAETYQMASGYYDAAGICLDVYLEGLDELLDWAETGDETALESSRRSFQRGDRELNTMLDEAFETEKQFQEIDHALLRSMGVNPEGVSTAGP